MGKEGKMTLSSSSILAKVEMSPTETGFKSCNLGSAIYSGVFLKVDKSGLKLFLWGSFIKQLLG